MKDNKNSFDLKQIAIVLAIFSLICLFTALIFDLQQGQVQSFTFKASSDGTITPQKFEVPRDNQVYLVKFNQSVARLKENYDWVNADVTIETKDGQVVTSFGGDFWRASGYDEGHWSEVKNQNKIKITIRHRGTYFLNLDISSNRSSFNSNLSVKLIPKRASSLPFTILGTVTLIIAIALGYFEQQSKLNKF